MILSEHDEIANQLIDQAVGQLLLDSTPYGLLHSLHITDQKTYNNFPLFMRVVIQLNSDFTNPVLDTAGQEIVSAVIQLIDLALKVNISPTVLKACEKNRKKIKEQEAKAKKEQLEES